MESLQEVQGRYPDQKIHLGSAIVLRPMKLHIAAPNRWVKNLSLY